MNYTVVVKWTWQHVEKVAEYLDKCGKVKRVVIVAVTFRLNHTRTASVTTVQHK